MANYQIPEGYVTVADVGQTLGLPAWLIRKTLCDAMAKMRRRNPQLRELLDALNERNTRGGERDC